MQVPPKNNKRHLIITQQPVNGEWHIQYGIHVFVYISRRRNSRREEPSRLYRQVPQTFQPEGEFEDLDAVVQYIENNYLDNGVVMYPTKDRRKRRH